LCGLLGCLEAPQLDPHLQLAPQQHRFFTCWATGLPALHGVVAETRQGAETASDAANATTTVVRKARDAVLITFQVYARYELNATGD
jgi:hypothetical protein